MTDPPTPRLAGRWLEGAQPVFAALAPHPAYAVGGAVRNALLGQPVADVDIATAARPEEVMRRAEAAGLRAVPTGFAHGTVTVVAGGEDYEVTTFRRDEESFGRHARVAFSDDLAEDARRRDFTLNALYATPAGEVVDPLGGLADCLARRVRFVGRAEERIREDYLRILRFFRFHAWYGAGPPDAAGLAACAALAGGLEGLSRERVGAEMMKLLAAPDPVPAVAAMAEAGVLAQVRPGAAPAALARLAAAGAPADPVLRLAALGGRGELRLSRRDARRIGALSTAALGAAGPGELGYRLGAAEAEAAMLLRQALTGAPPPPGWRGAVAAGAAAVFPLRAADLPETGAALGRRLAALEARWIASGFRLGRAELLAG